jgi:hypothetical protein
MENSIGKKKLSQHKIETKEIFKKRKHFDHKPMENLTRKKTGTEIKF